MPANRSSNLTRDRAFFSSVLLSLGAGYGAGLPFNERSSDQRIAPFTCSFNSLVSTCHTGLAREALLRRQLNSAGMVTRPPLRKRKGRALLAKAIRLKQQDRDAEPGMAQAARHQLRLATGFRYAGGFRWRR